MGKLTFEAGRYIWRGGYDENHLPKGAGFRFDSTIRPNKGWATDDARRASRLVAYADDSCRATLEQAKQAEEATLAESRATDAEISVPAPEGLSYMPFQRAGIRFALAREATLIGDEMGLGKTIQAIGVINGDDTINRVLVVCPAHLRINWRNELEKWLVRPSRVILASAKEWPTVDICGPGGKCVVVVAHYEAITRHQTLARNIAWDLLVVDEAHYIKNEKAQRTKAICGVARRKREAPDAPALLPLRARRRILMSGTPLANRPVELWPLVSYLDPTSFNNFWRYAQRYCDAFETGHGWDFSGASNLDELQDELRRTVMIRRLKRDVLTELPPKMRQVIEIAPNGAQAEVDAENAEWERHEGQLELLRADAELARAEGEEAYAAAVAKLRDAARVAFTEISRRRHATAVAKTPAVIEHVRNLLEERGKVVVFAHHHDVVNAIAAEFGAEAVLATGQESVEARTEAVRRFQEDATVKVMVASIMGAGTGFTMTAASIVVFAELDWVPGNVTQAEDRCHRIGQRDSVLIQHLVLDGSLDARMAKVLVEKQAVIDSALDAVHSARKAIALGKLDSGPGWPQVAAEAGEPVVPTRSEPATRTASQKWIDTVAAKMTPERIQAVHGALRYLAESDTDRASELNAIGFNKIDGHVGHSLAAQDTLTPRQAALGWKLVLKYRRQLGEARMAAMKGVEE